MKISKKMPYVITISILLIMGIVVIKSSLLYRTEYLENDMGYIKIHKKQEHMLSFAEFINENRSYDNQGYVFDTIKSIQTKLVDMGFLQPTLHSGKNAIDGKFGQATTDALSKFQIANELPDSKGMINNETLVKLGVSVSYAKSEELNNPKTNSESVSNYGNFSPSVKEGSPLIVVYGGIDVNNRKSGDYMYDYFKQTGNQYNLFVARDNRIDGYGAYMSLTSFLQNQKIYPTKKALYLFSGGQRPGYTLLNKVSPEEFEKIYLVDIYIGKNSETERFYTELAKKYPNKVEYYYTGSDNDAGGSVNLRAKRSIISSVNVSKRGSNHMLTNNDAVYSLMNYFKY
jgi:hypothetical protein